MICVVIKGPTIADAHRQVRAAQPYANLLEILLDGFHHWDESSLAALQKSISIPVIFTLRDRSQGGFYPHSEIQRRKDLQRLASLNPDFLDLEYHLPLSFVQEISVAFPKPRLILSYHNTQNTPQNLDSIFDGMQKYPVYLYKIAVLAENPIDTLRTLSWKAKQPNSLMTVISMGTHGQFSRIIGPTVNSFKTYACLDSSQQSAPGQIEAQTLVERYRYPALSSTTKVYGLLGDPVEKSLSDITHNALMDTFGLDAVYVKIPVKVSELSAFLTLAKQLPFGGFSITTPLKEAILPYLDEITPQAKSIGAVNTLLIHDGKISGYNTDGLGAVDALESEQPVAGKHVILLGAGGAAKAIAYELCHRGARLTILNRNPLRAQAIAQELGCQGADLEQMKALNYDFLINGTAVLDPIDPVWIRPGCVVMDINTRHIQTPFLQQAQLLGCKIVFGYQMFIEQAIPQFNLWFPGKIEIQKARMVLEQKTKEILQIV